jgi:Domain of unknown function (DUF4062)
LDEIKRVVVSSTVLDLPVHREKVRDACLKLRLLPLMMEHLPASSADAIRESRRLVNEADIYVGIFAHRYGFVPTDQEISITEMEYDLAKERGIDRLIFLMADDHPIVIGDVEFGVGADKITGFKKRLRDETVVNFFNSPEQLSASVIFSLSQYMGSPSQSFRLDGAQHELYEALVSLNPELGIMYLGGLMTLGQVNNPDRLAQAAHGLRELMEKLAKYVDVPVVNKPPSLKERVRVLAERRHIAIRNSSNRAGSQWCGEIDGHLQKFLSESDEFFDQFGADYVTRRRQTAEILRGLDPSASALPEQLEELNIAKWHQCNGYFQGVSHHTRAGVEDEFGMHLSELETLLLDRLAPQTSEDFAIIDNLIKEGEAGGTA